MLNFRRILVPLNLTDLDATVLRYVSMFCSRESVEKLYFLHAERRLDLPEQVIEEYPELVQPLDEYARSKMDALIRQHFHPGKEVEQEIEVIPGQPVDVILHHAVQKEIDLIVVGRKVDARETRRLPVRLTRKAPCPVWVVPAAFPPQISKILVPVDFSELSVLAMETAVHLARLMNLEAVYCLHSFSLPSDYYQTGKSEEEFTAILRQHTEREFDQFLSRFEHAGVQILPEIVREKRPTTAIETFIENNEVDLVVMGARGRTPATALLMGSVTEHVLLHSSIPVLAVKKKGMGLHLLKALLKI
ncbi:MAG: universal stress protein [Calditrichaeota bacterium]|nr:MAG: universal stress protein [Calditrichota bacterium]